MGFGKKFKRFTGSIGKAAGDLTGSKTVGRLASIAVGAALGAPVVSAPVGAIGGSSGYSGAQRQETQMKNAVIANEQNQAIQQVQQAQIAEEARLKLLAQQDLQTQLEQERKRTTFAGASMQGISERKRLLGV